MELNNYMEYTVKKNLDRALKKYNDICKCERCQLDIMAIALNNLKPKYIVSQKGELYSKVEEMDPQYDVDIIRELTRAINVVSKSPHHD